IVSPWKVGLACLSVSTSRLATAAPLTSGTDIPSTSEYTRLPTTTFCFCTVSFSANHVLVCNGWWFIVIMQNRWSSYSVMVLPGQWRYTSPTSKSSRWRPNGRSIVAMGDTLRSHAAAEPDRGPPEGTIPVPTPREGGGSPSRGPTTRLHNDGRTKPLPTRRPDEVDA